jgi:predicted amidophosphoribosyltransferase
MFYRFKTGEAALAYPLAKGMSEALAERGLLEADAIVPIPLSPEKIAAGEIHRTKLLSEALSQLIGVPVVDALRLTAPKGKRIARSLGQSDAQFRSEYSKLLDIDVSALSPSRTIILVDDVCTHGHTMRATLGALSRSGVAADVIAATAAQMTVRAAVATDRAVFRP